MSRLPRQLAASVYQCVLYHWDGIGVGVDGQAGPSMGRCMGGGDVIMCWGLF